MKMMEGTDGNMDYAVVMEKDGLCLGVKPIFEEVFKKAVSVAMGRPVAIGMRVRVARDPDTKDSDFQWASAGFAATKVFSTLPWQKTDEIRASCTSITYGYLQKIIETGFDNFLELPEVKTYLASFEKAMHEQASAIDCNIDTKKATDFVCRVWKTAFDNLLSEMSPAEEGSKVVPFEKE